MPFQDVIGHRRLRALLAGSIQRDTLPPSLIFSGPQGVGKRMVALATAQALNCLEPVRPSDSGHADAASSRPPGSGAGDASGQLTVAAGRLAVDACGRCLACQRIARGIHPDVMLIEPGDSGAIKIDQIRTVIERVAYRPFEGRRRAVVVDDADALVAPAQNALLKTLEEPPAASVFILVTSRPDALLPTVRSRCVRLQFRPLAVDDVARGLMAHGHAERDAHAVAALADGSLGRALDASADALVDARELAGKVLAQAAGTGDPSRRLEAAKDLLVKTGGAGETERSQMATKLRAMSSLLRDLELLVAGADPNALANPDMRPALDRLTTPYAGQRAARAFVAVDRALVALDRNAGVKIVADWLVLQL